MFLSAHRLMRFAQLLVMVGALILLLTLAANVGLGGASLPIGVVFFVSFGTPCTLMLAALALDQLLWSQARAQLRRFSEARGGGQLVLSAFGHEKGNLWWMEECAQVNVRLCNSTPSRMGVDLADRPGALQTGLGLRFGRQTYRSLIEVTFLPDRPLTRPFGLWLAPRLLGQRVQSAGQLKRCSRFTVKDLELQRLMQAPPCVDALLALARFRLLRIDVRSGGFSVRCNTVPLDQAALEVLIQNARILFEAFAAACGVALERSSSQEAASDWDRPELMAKLAAEAHLGEAGSGALAPSGEEDEKRWAPPEPEDAWESARAARSAAREVGTKDVDDERRWAPPGYFGEDEEAPRAIEAREESEARPAAGREEHAGAGGEVPGEDDARRWAPPGTWDGQAGSGDRGGGS